MNRPALLKKKKKKREMMAIILTEDNARFQFPAPSQARVSETLLSRMFCWLYRAP